jgi:hypothetical protein
MADTPREKTRSNWWVLGVLAVIALIAVIYYGQRNTETLGGSLSAGETTQAHAQSTQGPSAAVPAQSQNP